MTSETRERPQTVTVVRVTVNGQTIEAVVPRSLLTPKYPKGKGRRRK